MEKKIEKTKVYNVIIMDRSGSMWDIRKRSPPSWASTKCSGA